MNGETFGLKLRDALLTIPAVWLILILAGMSGARLQPSLAGAALSVAVCVGLLLAWGHWAGPGRRTALPVYLLAGLLYPILSMALLLSVPTQATESVQWLFAGMALGYQPGGGPDTPLEYSIIPMLLNLFGPILLMGLLRSLVRRDWSG